MDSNVLSSICLGSASRNNTAKYGGCVDVFLHLFDWNRRRGFLSNKLLAAERMPTSTSQDGARRRKKRKDKRPSKEEDRIPMAKLLLIAEEKRRSSERSSAAQEPSGNQRDKPTFSKSRSSPSAVAKLMGLEQIPADEEVHSLQELLHLDREPPMLQELLSGNSNSNSFQEVTAPKEEEAALFSLLVKEVKATPPLVSKRRKRPNSKASNKQQEMSSTSCGGFSKSVFLQAAARLLERSSRAPHAILDKEEAQAEDEEGTETSYGRRSNSSASSIPSLMELLCEDGEESCSPRVPIHHLGEHDYVSFRDFLTRSHSSSSCSSAPSSMATVEAIADPEEAEEHQHRTSGSGKHNGGGDMSSFVVLENPLFEEEEEGAEEGCSGRGEQSHQENASDVFFDSEAGDDSGLEDILKSILSDASKRRMTWSPRESYVFTNNTNKDCSHDDESVEATSESNCGSDGQPSPVSVLDISVFEDDVPSKEHHHLRRRSSSRKKLEFGEPSPALLDAASPPTITATSQQQSISKPSPSPAVYDDETLGEAYGYVSMVLRDSGLQHHKEALLLLLEPTTILDLDLFERVEDRLRVEQLIEHLEAYNHGGDGGDQRRQLISANLSSLRSHYNCYQEYRSQRRLVFDFVAETLDSVLEELVHQDELFCSSSSRKHLKSGVDVACEVESRVRQWRRGVDLESEQCEDTKLDTRCSRSLRAEVSRIAGEFEKEIFTGLLDDLANDLLVVS